MIFVIGPGALILCTACELDLTGSIPSAIIEVTLINFPIGQSQNTGTMHFSSKPATLINRSVFKCLFHIPLNFVIDIPPYAKAQSCRQKNRFHDNDYMIFIQ